MEGSASIFCIFSDSKLCSLSYTRTPTRVSSLSGFNTIHFSLGHLMARLLFTSHSSCGKVLSHPIQAGLLQLCLFSLSLLQPRETIRTHTSRQIATSRQPISSARMSKSSYFVPFLWASCVAPFCESRTRLFFGLTMEEILYEI